MRVFVSSTVYDLIDIRAEVAALLREIGITPVMSDDWTSDFNVPQSKNSIETCLVNVDTSDAVIVILDQRYGPTLGKFEYEDVSATHLEYKRAVKKGKPIHLFARDRLVADHDIWKRNGRAASVELSWVRTPADRTIFSLLEEHSQLTSDTSKSNWYNTFTDSTDLNGIIGRRFERQVLPERFTEAVNRNEFPLMQPSASARIIGADKGNLIRLLVNMEITNVGGAAAFNVAHSDWNVQNVVPGAREKALMPPRDKTSVIFEYEDWSPAKQTRNITFQYDSIIGIRVTTIYEVSFTAQTDGRISGDTGLVHFGPIAEALVRQLEQTFTVGPKAQLRVI